MTKRIIFLNGEPRGETAWLGKSLHEAGFDYRTSPADAVGGAGLRETGGDTADDFISISEDDATGKTSARTTSPVHKSPPVLAALCAVAEDAEVSELRTMVKRACTRWPEAALVAYRLPPSDDDFGERAPGDDSHIDSDRVRPSSSTLRRLGFTQIADAAEQLSVVLNRIAARGATGDFPRPHHELHHASSSSHLPDNLSAERLRVAFEFASALHFAFDQEAAAETALAAFVHLVRADAWTIYLTLETRSSTGAAPLLQSLATTGKPSESGGQIPHASHASQILQASKVAHGAVTGEATRATENGRRIVAVPLVSDEKIIGVLEGTRTRVRARTFTDAEVNLLVALAAPLAASLANVGRVAEAERLSQTDDLTKLHNARFLRQCLISEIKRARRYGSTVSTLFLDLDNFKQVNDQHGHLVGSHVLIELAAVILRSVRDTDIVARYGGDEFVVILPETPASAAHRVAERMRAGIEDATFTGGRGNLRLRLTASFGVAAFPEHAQSPQQLIIAADAAMYEAKASRKNCVFVARTGKNLDE